MISLLLDPDVTRFRADIRDWALAEVRPWARQADLDHRPPPRDVIDQVVKACPIDLRTSRPAEIPESTIRLSQGPALLGTILLEEMSYGDHWMAWELPGTGIGTASVKLLGTDAQKERWIGGMADGTYSKAAFALTEPGFGSDASKVATTAVRDGDQWILNGSKMYCSGGASADYIVVFATIDPSRGAEGIRGFVVERGTPGFSVPKPNEEKMGLRSSETSELLFTDAAVPLDHCLGWSDGSDTTVGNAGFVAAITTLDTSRPAMASMSIGMARAALDTAAEWFAQRRGAFTPARRARVEDDLAMLGHQLDRARLLVNRAVWLRDGDLPNRREVSIAKAYGPPLAERVIRRCIQLMGPDGWSQDYLVEKWYRDVKIFDIFEGSGQIQRMIIARETMGRVAARA